MDTIERLGLEYTRSCDFNMQDSDRGWHVCYDSMHVGTYVFI